MPHSASAVAQPSLLARPRLLVVDGDGAASAIDHLASPIDETISAIKLGAREYYLAGKFDPVFNRECSDRLGKQLIGEAAVRTIRSVRT